MLTFKKKGQRQNLIFSRKFFYQDISYAMSNFIHIQVCNMSGPEVLAGTQLCDLEKW